MIKIMFKIRPIYSNVCKYAIEGVKTYGRFANITLFST